MFRFTLLLKNKNYCRGTTKKRIPNFLQNTKIVINSSPRGRFEHLGVETGSKLHARHDGHSEIIS